MFICKQRNLSGSVSVQVIVKANGYRVVKTMGSFDEPQNIQRLVELGTLFIERQSGQYLLFHEDQHDRAAIADFVKNLGNTSIRTAGPELILGRLFDEIGFNVIPEQLFRDIVVARLAYPTSKGKTVFTALKRIQQQYCLDKPVVVADAAMLSKDNLDALD